MPCFSRRRSLGTSWLPGFRRTSETSRPERPLLSMALSSLTRRSSYMSCVLRLSPVFPLPTSCCRPISVTLSLRSGTASTPRPPRRQLPLPTLPRSTSPLVLVRSSTRLRSRHARQTTTGNFDPHRQEVDHQQEPTKEDPDEQRVSPQPRSSEEKRSVGTCLAEL
jgi:hypothetical protein